MQKSGQPDARIFACEHSENELIEAAGAKIDKKRNTPVSASPYATSVDGVFTCGNSYRVYDVVDSVSLESEEAGRLAARYLKEAP